MERKQVRVSLSRLLVIALGLLVGLTSAALADGPQIPGRHHKPCSNATLDGSYAYYRAGTILPDGGTVAAVGIATFDGKGNTVGTDSVNRNGEVELDLEWSTLYQVSPDCSGKFVNEDGDAWAWFIVVNGGQGYYLLLDGNPVYVVATRIDKD